MYELDVEIWPMSFVFPKGWRLVLTVGTSDFQHDLPGPWPEIYGKPHAGLFRPSARPPQGSDPGALRGEVSIHTGGAILVSAATRRSRQTVEALL